MENILRTLYQERASLPSTLGILLIDSSETLETVTESFDWILLVITDEPNNELFVKHYIYEEKKIVLYVVNKNHLKEWIVNGTNRKVFDWLFTGKILFERNDYLHHLIQELNDFPFYERKQRLGLEYAKLIRRYIEGRKLFERKNYFDAYNYVIQSLHHLVRLSLIEKGFHPEVTVWDQVKNIEPQIYKIYEELLNSDEPLDKRLELLFLASDFFIHSRTEIGAAHIIDILKEKELWSIQNIINHPDLKMYSTDMFDVLDYLVEKEYLYTVEEESKGKDISHRYYTVEKAENS